MSLAIRWYGTLLFTALAGIFASGEIWATNYASGGRVFGIIYPMLVFSLYTRNRSRPLALALCVLSALLTAFTIYRAVAITPALSSILTP